MQYHFTYQQGLVILRPVSLAIAIAFSILFVRIAAGQANTTSATEPGIQKHVPDTGWYVKTDRGVMVPYQVSFHNSNAKFVMQPIPGGRFVFEIPQVLPEADQKLRERIEPRHIAVDVEPFWIGVHEVTWGEYRQFQKLEYRFKENENRTIKLVEEQDEFDIVTAPSAVYDAQTIEQAGKEENQPAVCMTQYSAKQYTKYLSLSTGSFYRLPSAAQWQYACLAGREPEELLEGVAMLDLNAWSKRNAKERRHRVGALKPNPWGICDMQGNVSEWVLDDARFAGKQWQGMSLTDEQAISWPDAGWGRLVCGGDFTTIRKTACTIHGRFRRKAGTRTIPSFRKVRSGCNQATRQESASESSVHSTSQIPARRKKSSGKLIATGLLRRSKVTSMNLDAAQKERSVVPMS